MSRPIGSRMMPAPALITPACRLSLGSGFGGWQSAPASGTSPWSDAANCLLAFPFQLEAQTTFYKGFASTGSSAGSNFEVGIWDDAYNKIVTSGSVSGGAVASVPVIADFTDTTLPPGLYYAGMACNATTTNRWTRWSVATTGAAIWQSAGCWRQSGITLGSLAATATPGDMTNVAFPVFGLITRSVFDA